MLADTNGAFLKGNFSNDKTRDNSKIGRTIPSFRIALAMEKEEWKPFRNALDKSERKMFDEMWDIPRLYVSACSNSVQLVPLHPLIISILSHHYKESKECIYEFIRIAVNRGSNNNNNNNNNNKKKKKKKKERLMEKEEEDEQEEKTKPNYYVIS